MGFNGFPKDTRVFLRELAANNQREWFEANKKRFETVGKAPLSDLCLAVADLGAREDLDISGDPKRSPFRIYRDVRFSKDKSPYKTHLSAFFGPNGDKKELGGVFSCRAGALPAGGRSVRNGYQNADGDPNLDRGPSEEVPRHARRPRRQGPEA